MTDLTKFIILTTLASGLTLSASAESWPQYRGPHSDGISSSELALSASTKAKRLWKTPTPNGFSSFSVDGGRAFTVVSRELGGKPAEVCVALDAATAKELWAVPTGVANYPGGGESGTEDNKGGDGPRSTPTVSGNHVFVYSAEMLLSCLDAATGKTLWSKDIRPQPMEVCFTWPAAGPGRRCWPSTKIREKSFGKLVTSS